MAEVQTWYEASAWGDPSIHEVQVIEETATKVRLRTGRLRLKESDGRFFCPTKQSAEAAIAKYLQRQVTKAEGQLLHRQTTLQNWVAECKSHAD